MCIRDSFPPDLLAGTRVGDRQGTPPAARPHSHESFETEVWPVPEDIDEEQLRARLSQPGLLRAKGFVRLGSEVRLVQVVGRRIEIHPGDREADPELLGRIVLIRRAGA